MRLTVGKTPLSYAVDFSDGSIDEILLERGATVNIQNYKGRTPLYLAVLKHWENEDGDEIMEPY